MAHLALDANATVDFSAPYWAAFLQTRTRAYFAGLGQTGTQWGGLPACHDGNRGEIIIHPLWSELLHGSVNNARQAAIIDGIRAPVIKTLFEVVRRPF